MWADFFELVCLVNCDQSITLSDIKDRIFLDSQDIAQPIDYENDEDGTIQSSGEERAEERAWSYMNYFSFRSVLYGDDYPFIITTNGIKVKENLEDKHLFYIYLLCCSNLSYFKREQSDFSSEFEFVSKTCLENYQPVHGVVKIFGKNTSATSSYSGNIFHRFKHLSQELDEMMLVEESHFPSSSTGDGGIDIISWVPFRDDLNGKVVYVGQCKCSDKWKEASDPVHNLRHIISDRNKYVSLMFIPFCFRDLKGKWFQPQSANKFITIDRYRMVTLFSDKISIFTTLKSYTIVKQFLTEKESVI